MIYHVATPSQWTAQLDAQEYVADSLQTEGFIHCSTVSQVSGVLERYYASEPDVLMLHIDEAKLQAELKYEVSTNQEAFPHVFGPINKGAVVELSVVKQEGELCLPAFLRQT